MTLENIKKKLEETGLPVAYRSFPENESPGLPFICYMEDHSNNFGADGKVYLVVKHLYVELYTRFKELELEAKVEEALNPFFWYKEETEMEEEHCYMVRYELED